MFVIFATRVFLLKVVWRGTENQFIINWPVLPVKYAANAFTVKTTWGDTCKCTNWRSCLAIQRLVQPTGLLTYHHHCRFRLRLLLLPRGTMKRPCATFALRRSLARRCCRRTIHHQSGGFSCWVCDQRFYRRDHLKRHHIRKHANQEYKAPATPAPWRRWWWRGGIDSGASGGVDNRTD